MEDYRNSEAPVLLKERQSEETLSGVSANKAKAGVKRATKPRKPRKTMSPGTPDQIAPALPAVAAKEESSIAIPDQIAPVPPTDAAKEQLNLATPDPIVSALPTDAAKEESNPAIPDPIPSDASKTRAMPLMTHGVKAGKQMNRNLALLLVSFFAIGLIVMGAFLWQKSDSVAELSSRLDSSSQALTESTKNNEFLQTQLAASQQVVEGLTNEVSQAQLEIESLQAEINVLKSPPLIPGQPLEISGGIYVNGLISFPIEMKQFEQVQGEIIAGGPSGLAFSIKDPAGATVKDLGKVVQSNFMFTAQISGKYLFVIEEVNGANSSYRLRYTLYQRQ